MNTFIQEGRIKLIKIESKNIYNVAKDSISNKCYHFEYSIHLWILKNKMSQVPQKYSTVQLFNIDNNQKCFLSNKAAY